MAIATTSAIRQTVQRLKRAWAEMDYAQRRMFEIRSGIRVNRPNGSSSHADDQHELAS